MSNVNLSITSGKAGGNSDSEVLVRRQRSFMIFGLESSIV
jgi:hypothetical protein